MNPTLFHLLFIVSCLVAFGASIYLAMARCYQTGIFGSIGLGAMALGVYVHFTNWFFDTGGHPSPQTKILIIGLALFLAQHVFRVITKTRIERKRNRGFVIAPDIVTSLANARGRHVR